MAEHALQSLREYLASMIDQSERDSNESDAEYDHNISAFRKVVNEETVLIPKAVLEVINGIPVHGQTYRICSLGCGNGALDEKILELLIEQFPAIKFQYIGLDINAFSIKKAKERFASGKLSTVTNVEADAHIYNIETKDLSIWGKFDSVLALHSMVYMESATVTATLPKFVELLKPQGELFMMHTGIEDPLSKLNEVFKKYQAKKCSTLSKEQITNALSEMEGIDYTNPEESEAVFDLTKFKSDKALQERVLDFIVHVPLLQFPSDVSKLCMEYLECAHQEHSGKLITKMYSMIVRKK